MGIIQKIREKLVLQLLFLVIIIFALLLCAFLLTKRQTGKLIRQNTLELSWGRLLIAESRLDSFFENLENVAASFSYSPTTEQYLTQDSLSRVPDAAALSVVFTNTLLLENDICSIYLYGADMERIAGFGKEFAIPDERVPKITKVEIGPGFLSEKANHLYYSFYYPIYDLDTPTYHNLKGVCIIILSPDSLDELLNDISLTKNSEIYLLDQEGCILSSSQLSPDTSLEEEMLEESKDCQVQKIVSSISGWQIVCRIPESDLVSQQSGIDTIMLLLYGISLLLLLAILCFFYFHVLRPIHAIDYYIRTNMDKPEERLYLERRDEIGTVSCSLNQMLDKRREMNEKVQQAQKKMYEKELAVKQAQVIAYRNQINPHFLYNTLECIRDMALYYEADGIAEVTMALSSLFRYAVKGSNLVTVAQEIENIREYAKIIEYRFMGKISVDVSLDPRVSQKQMMKLLLQPLVENAVFHGLEQKVEEGLVDISIQPYHDDGICFVIEDDGCGISQERLHRLMYEIKSPDQKDRIGIANIYHRLKLLYEDKFTFDIKSEVGMGTRITIITKAEIDDTKGNIQSRYMDNDC